MLLELVVAAVSGLAALPQGHGSLRPILGEDETNGTGFRGSSPLVGPDRWWNYVEYVELRGFLMRAEVVRVLERRWRARVSLALV